MKKNLLFIILLFQFVAKGQSPNTRLGYSGINKKYLEHLIKKNIDSVRNKYNCKSLVNDSILYVASEWHANYIKEKKKLSHTEKDIPEKETPQLRAEFYGARNYLVGENVLKTSYNATIKNKKKKELPTYTYGELAFAIVDGWVNSKGHFKNIVTEDYQITGVNVAIDEKSRVVYAVQKFAQVPYVYEFKENEKLFSYSNYTTPEAVNSFDNISNTLGKHKHQWKIKHGDEVACKTCEEVTKDKPFIKLEYRDKAFYLRIENSAFVQQLIRDKKDGFAVEIVEFDDYACGNPAYYTKPSRRNGQCQINGKVVEPLYKKELFKGYKKRKVKKDLNFISYLFGKNSTVGFFKRFSGFKIDKFTSEYFEIKLGKLPKNVNGLWGYNLLYLQNNKVCKVEYFTSYCGEVFADYKPTTFIPLDSDSSYQFANKKDTFSFVFPFEKNKTRINEGDIAPFTSKFEVSDFKVDSLHIVAYSSIEGNNAQNERLQRNRANSIIQLLSKNQLEAVSSSVEVKNSWENFYDTIRTIKKWRELAKKDTNELLAYVNKHVADFESILEKQRKASVDIFASIPFSQNNFSYYIQAENNRLLKLIESNPKDSYEELEKLNRLYAFAQYHLNKKSISFKRFKEFKLNEIALSYMPILERYLTNYYYHQDSIKLTNKQVSDLEKLLLENEPSLLFLYNYCVSNTRYLLADKNPKQEDVQTIFHYLERLKRSYFDDPQMKKRIEELVLNLNFLLLEKVFIDIPEEANEDAQKSISFIHEYYQSKNELNDTIALKIGKLAVYYGETQFAVALLQQFNNSPHVLPYLLQLGYYHPSASTNRAYYEQLISSFDMLGDATWCNLFFDTCKIPFQAFDDEKLRDTFCEECISKSEFYKDLLKIK